ncbi:MAG: hypothetical protein K6G73_09140 [Marinilabiliaceae bacterium]|nr:hypothetical protein [Marinilabiliaceae bacterium]
MKRNLFTLLALCAVLSFTGCKEEEPSQIPTVPTTFSLEDGATVDELTVKLSASGSTVEDNGLNVSYVYYIGKSADALEKTSAEVTLEPYTQYFWCAQAKTEAGEGEKTEVRTFYCVPTARIELSRSFGENENATTIKWELYKRGEHVNMIYYYKSDYEEDSLRYWIESPRFEMQSGSWMCVGKFYKKEALNISEAKRKQMSITIDISSDEIQDEIKSLELAGDVDSVLIRPQNVNNKVHYDVYKSVNGQKELNYVAAYKYNFNVNVDIPVGDKVVKLTSSIESILVNNDTYAVDKELNIYRAIPIGDDIWTIDNLRLSKSPHDYIYVYNKECGDVTYHFVSSDKIKYLNECIINGYHVSTGDDWQRLENHFGIEYGEDIFGTTYEAQLAFEKEDESTHSLSKYFATNVPWDVFSDEKISEGNYLNSFNVHCYGIDTSLSDAVVFYVNNGKERIISKKYKSIALAGMLSEEAVIRLVKDRE